MTSPKPQKPKNSKKSYDDASKALRDNLLRRKQQIRSREVSVSQDDSKTENQMIYKPGSVKSNNAS